MIASKDEYIGTPAMHLISYEPMGKILVVLNVITNEKGQSIDRRDTIESNSCRLVIMSHDSKIALRNHFTREQFISVKNAVKYNFVTYKGVSK